MKILITGAAGFIGFHVAKRLCQKCEMVIGVDNINNYYDTSLKYARLEQLDIFENFRFIKMDITDKDILDDIFMSFKPEIVIHLAAQAGVRYSLENPYAYIDSNIVGYINILEACRHYPVKHLIYASSSSVYGGNKTVPFSTNHQVDHPVSLYAATKKSNELMAYTYSHLYDIPTTGLRFFTVYGPWGRPDMAYFSFTNNIINGDSIKVFNHGEMERDFTYIDDIVDGIELLMYKPPVKNKTLNNDQDVSSSTPYKIYNIGNNSPVALESFISTLEDKVGKKARKVYMEMQPGDVMKTYADVSDLINDTGFQPKTSIEAGLSNFVNWYKTYYKIK